MTYEDVARRLTAEAVQLFQRMVRCHLSAAGTREFMVLRFMGPDSPKLLFHGDGANETLTGIDEGALQDLTGYGLLQVARYSKRGEPTYRVGSEGLTFNKWLLERQGTAVDQTGAMVRALVDGEAFGHGHPSASHHLNKAYDLLLEGRTDVQTISEIGDHLRKAIMDVTSDVVGEDGGKQEYPIERLKRWVASRSMGDRDRLVLERLVDLADAVLSLDHRLNHVRDEVDRGRAVPTWPEMRRAAWITTMVCAELPEL